MLEVKSIRLSFQAAFRISSCGVLLGEVMVAFTEHPVVDVVLVVEDTALGSTNIQVNNHVAQKCPDTSVFCKHQLHVVIVPFYPPGDQIQLHCSCSGTFQWWTCTRGKVYKLYHSL